MIEYIKGVNIVAKLENESFKLPDEIQRKIEEFWNKAKSENPSLFNGELMCVSDYRKEKNLIEIICKKSNYAHYLYDERIGLPDQYACSSLVAGCLLETSDDYYVIGELDKSTSFPYCMQTSGGSSDDNDIKDGNIDFINTIVRECKEELNIDLLDKKLVEGFELKYISLPEGKIHQYILFAKGKLNIDRFQMEKYYNDYLKYLQENDLEIEFGKIHFIKKENADKELDNFKNPKRNYLKELLKIDSREEY